MAKPRMLRMPRRLQIHNNFMLVREGGLEPPCLSAQDPKSCASPSSATLARSTGQAGEITYAKGRRCTMLETRSRTGKIDALPRLHRLRQSGRRCRETIGRLHSQQAVRPGQTPLPAHAWPWPFSRPKAGPFRCRRNSSRDGQTKNTRRVQAWPSSRRYGARWLTGPSPPPRS